MKKSLGSYSFHVDRWLSTFCNIFLDCQNVIDMTNMREERKKIQVLPASDLSKINRSKNICPQQKTYSAANFLVYTRAPVLRLPLWVLIMNCYTTLCIIVKLSFCVWIHTFVLLFKRFYIPSKIGRNHTALNIPIYWRKFFVGLSKAPTISSVLFRTQNLLQNSLFKSFYVRVSIFIVSIYSFICIHS